LAKVGQVPLATGSIVGVVPASAPAPLELPPPELEPLEVDDPLVDPEPLDPELLDEPPEPLPEPPPLELDVPPEPLPELVEPPPPPSLVLPAPPAALDDDEQPDASAIARTPSTRGACMAASMALPRGRDQTKRASETAEIRDVSTVHISFPRGRRRRINRGRSWRPRRRHRTRR
jgi:hypothetical protein